MTERNSIDLKFELIKAKDGDKGVRVSGLAYGGGAIRLAWWEHPVVIDLAGMEFPGNIPLLADHWNSTDSRVGLVSPTIKNNALLIDGEIVSTSATASEILEQLKAGAEWQLSIGASADKYELVEEGTREINGQTFTAPFFHVTKSTLREVSVVAIGADSSTRMRVAATFKLSNSGGGNMPESKEKDQAALVAAQEPKTPVAPKAIDASAILNEERERIAAIRELCAGEHAEIEAEAIKAGWSADETSRKVLAAIRSARPNADKGISIHAHGQDVDARTIEAALCFRAGIDEQAMLKAYGEKVVEKADRNRGMSLQQVFAECARLEGRSVPYTFGNDTIRAAFTTTSLSGILGNVANKRLLKAFLAQSPIALRLCSEGDLNDFKEAERYRLNDVGDLEQIAADGELKSGGLEEGKATNKLETYGKTFVLTRQMIYNDDLGAFLKIPAMMGARAARKIDLLFFTRLLSNPTMEDSVVLFHTTHKNIATGAGSALSKTALEAAIKLFLNQTIGSGESAVPINVNPKYLLVPPDLKFTGLELTKSASVMAIGETDTTGIPTYNALKDENLETLASPYLSNTNITGYSTTAWYLFGDPAMVETFEIGYLQGKKTPTIEQGDTDFNTLGKFFRVYFDLGVREQDHRGMVKCAGA